MTERLPIHQDAEDVTMEYTKKKREEAYHYLNLEKAIGKRGKALRETEAYKDFELWVRFMDGLNEKNTE